MSAPIEKYLSEANDLLDQVLQLLTSGYIKDTSFAADRRRDKLKEHIEALRKTPLVFFETSDEPETADGIPLRVISSLLKIRDALVRADKDEAYHVLYSIAHPQFDKVGEEVWKLWESLVAGNEEVSEELPGKFKGPRPYDADGFLSVEYYGLGMPLFKTQAIIQFANPDPSTKTTLPLITGRIIGSMLVFSPDDLTYCPMYRVSVLGLKAPLMVAECVITTFSKA